MMWRIYTYKIYKYILFLLYCAILWFYLCFTVSLIKNNMVSPQTKEWLCLTCQMQRALTAAELAEPPPMKPPASPNKMSTPASAQKDTIANQKGDIITTQKAEVPDKKQKDSPIPQKKEEIKTSLQKDITQTSTTASPVAKETPDVVSVPTEEEKTGSPPTKEVPTSTAPPTKATTAVVSDLNKSLPDQALPVSTDIETSVQKKKDLTPETEVSDKKDEKDEVSQKSADQPVKSSDAIQPQQALNKESNLVETSLAKSAPPATQPTQQESGGFFSFGSPKSQRAASITTEAVTGKMLGFGSSLFSSASTLITSAVQEESRTTPPTSRKMSAPPQVSDKISTSPKSSPPVSPRMTSAKEAKSAAQKPNLEKAPDQPREAKAPPSGQTQVKEASQASTKVDQSCPLCKAELNIGSMDPPNYKTCTECKTNVCNKCGFSPMPNVTEVSK